ncbi:MAG: Histidine kinase [Parcubacteria group bacterium GW2011_GWF2_38_76]|nr:MAG: Histidine kinase [Parcubacteria group bacterium GW2011_GWF2_38_76]HBM45699.1 hypothetical protein [Patescibacteria group bacterium]
MEQKIDVSHYKYSLTLIFIITIIWWVILQIIPDKTTNWNFLYNSENALIFLLSGIFSLFLIKKTGISELPRKAINTLSVALMSYGMGLIVWTIYNFFYMQEVPFPSIADIFFVAFYPLVLISVFYYLQIFSFILKRQILIEAIVLFSILSFIIFTVLDVKISSEMSLLAKILTIFYPLSSAIILSGAIMIIRVGGGAIKNGAMFLSLGLASQGLADFLFSFRTATGTYWNGDYSDIMFTISAFIIGIANLTIISKLIPNQENAKPTII